MLTEAHWGRNDAAPCSGEQLKGQYIIGLPGWLFLTLFFKKHQQPLEFCSIAYDYKYLCTHKTQCVSSDSVSRVQRNTSIVRSNTIYKLWRQKGGSWSGLCLYIERQWPRFPRKGLERKNTNMSRSLNLRASFRPFGLTWQPCLFILTHLCSTRILGEWC